MSSYGLSELTLRNGFVTLATGFIEVAVSFRDIFLFDIFLYDEVVLLILHFGNHGHLRKQHASFLLRCLLCPFNDTRNDGLLFTVAGKKRLRILGHRSFRLLHLVDVNFLLIRLVNVFNKLVLIRLFHP